MSEAGNITRDSAGRFAKLVCVNAHDRCYEGVSCPYCEPQERKRIAKALGNA